LASTGRTSSVTGVPEAASLEPVVLLGLMNSMAVVIANIETVVSAGAEHLDDASARVLLERALAHARITSDALAQAVHDMPPSVAAALDDCGLVSAGALSY